MPRQDPTTPLPHDPASPRDLRPVHLRARGAFPGAKPGAPVELLGEVCDWQTGIPLASTPTSKPDERIAEATLDLPVGMYSYKLRAGGSWSLDLDNPRTRSRDRIRNSVLSIGGAPEPLLFAPAPPFVVRAPEDDHCIVTAGVRRGHGTSLRLSWESDDARGTIEMTRAAEEDEHLFFRAELPAAAGVIRIHFDPGPNEAFSLVLAPADDLPAWWKHAVLYTIFVDRFAPRPGASWGHDPGRDRPAGGHIDGIRLALPRLAALGVTVLYLTPTILAASCHRYDLVDPLQIDPALGGEPAFERLAAEARARGIRILVDLAFSHAGRGFPPYEDVHARGLGSPFAAWFHWTTPSRGAPKLRHYGRRKDAPLLNLDHPEVRALVLSATSRWAKRGASGLRLDMAAEVPHDLAVSIRDTFRREIPDAVVLGELVPAHAHRWTSRGALDCATDFGFHDVLVDFLAKRAIPAELAAQRLARLDLDRGAPGARSLRFVSTHDHPRFTSIARKHGGPSRSGLLGLFVLLAWPGVPSLLYGEEYDLFAETPIAEPEDVWPDRMPLPLRPDSAGERAFSIIRSLLALRASHPALGRGALEILFAEGGLFLFRRTHEGEILDVAVNVASPVDMDLEDDEFPVASLLFALGEARLSGQTLTLAADAAALVLRAR
ncbi:alpha-amylase family glycosyl hydrolase [Polyangium sorediatum]|uniref:Alpha-amylase family glycosyl hydrolase n=1 Tax=Polyangium sorediatum TaxID=889274 RepID=A0ABT6NRX9_9BACT|nr:alpha-amylase family glycosyl hydrolase [Polyangium sorediatum]MDI1430910.1 alpha-amylase family glycosyl hydrolase [Polyangium sorediatum]